MKKIFCRAYIWCIVGSLLSALTTLVCADARRYKEVPKELVYLATPQEAQLRNEWPIIGEESYYTVLEDNYFFPTSYVKQLLEKATAGHVVIQISTKHLKERFFNMDWKEQETYGYTRSTVPATAVITFHKKSESACP